MDLYAFEDYRELIKAAAEEKKKTDYEFTFQSLAEACAIQKSYLSSVFSRKAHLNTDQLYLIAEYFEWSEDVRRYIELLAECGRTGLSRRRETLLKKIRDLQAEKLETTAHIQAPSVSSDHQLMEYYLNPWTQIVHVSLSVKRYGEDMKLLAQDLNLPLSVVNRAVQSLLKSNIIESRADGFHVLKHSLHLPKKSPLYMVWRTQLKLLASQRLQSGVKDADYSFSVVFSADSRTKNKIQTKFLELLKEVESDVKDSKAEDTYQMSFDLFPWT